MTQSLEVLQRSWAGDQISQADYSRQLHSLLQRAFAALAFSALWGLAAGSAAPAQALANVYKVPMVMALSLIVALPAVLVSRHLLRVAVSPFALVSALVTSVFRSSLVLLGFAPLLGVYAYTSRWVAPVLAQGSAGLALVCGGAALCWELSELRSARWQTLTLGAVAVVTLGLALLQLISVATPVLTLPTVFGAGIDGVLE